MGEENAIADVSNNEAESRFELHAGGKNAFLAYRRSAEEIVLTHTEVPVEMEGQGVGS
jgi:predicted GNAT family acetyltransferase